MTASQKTVVQALSAAMTEIGAVAKGDVNSQQGFKFRGIDATVNAVSPVFRKHGLVVVPDLREIARSTVEVGTKRTLMGHVAVTVAYTFHGPAGDSITAVVPGESMDSGDKATAKAMSVAFRTALLQSLCLPTDDPDPDHQVYERSAVDPDREECDELLDLIGTAAAAAGISKAAVADEFTTAHDGRHIKTGTPAELRAVLKELEQESPAAVAT